SRIFPMAVNSGNRRELTVNRAIDPGLMAQGFDQAGAEGGRNWRSAGGSGPLRSTSDIERDRVAHPDTKAQADSVAIALGPVEQGFSLGIAPQINPLGQRASLFAFNTDSIGVIPSRSTSGVALNAGIGVKRGQGDAIAAALEPAKTEPVLPECG